LTLLLQTVKLSLFRISVDADFAGGIFFVAEIVSKKMQIRKDQSGAHSIIHYKAVVGKIMKNEQVIAYKIESAEPLGTLILY
jgi:hypothetical protein